MTYFWRSRAYGNILRGKSEEISEVMERVGLKNR
jgi:hypothetical protein